MKKDLNLKLTLTFFLLTAGSGCSTLSSIFATAPKDGPAPPIRDPFVDNVGVPASGHAMIVRSKEGNRSVEVEVPASQQNVSDLVIPLQEALGGRSPAAIDGASMDDSYKKRKPSEADHEITSTFPHSSLEDDAERRGIEKDLGLMATDSGVPENDASYLAAVDHVKQLFHIGRYEAALLEVEDLLRQYPTSPQLYSMRGTLLDRVGQPQLAIESWSQALRFDPKNEALRRYIDRKRKIASVPGS